MYLGSKLELVGDMEVSKFAAGAARESSLVEISDCSSLLTNFSLLQEAKASDSIVLPSITSLFSTISVSILSSLNSVEVLKVATFSRILRLIASSLRACKWKLLAS